MKLLKNILLGVVGLGVFLSAGVAIASVTFRTPTQPSGTFIGYTFFTATTTTATSTNTTDGGGYLALAGAKRVDLYFSRAATSTNNGQSRFRIQVTPDGVNWYDYNKLVGNDVSSTATSSVTITQATSTVITALDLRADAFYAVRCIVNQTVAGLSDGTQTCAASAEY